MRSTFVLSLLLIPALAGCLGGTVDPLPLDTTDLVVDVEEAGTFYADTDVELHATPVLEDATYTWELDGATYEGPDLRLLLDAGIYVATLTAERDGKRVSRDHPFEVLAPIEPETDDEPDDSEEADDPSTTDPAPPPPCVFGSQNIGVTKTGTVYSFSYPWPCQPAAWEWNLGDGSHSREASVEHSYERDGRYTVTLTITHNDQDLTYTHSVLVDDTPLRIVPVVNGNEATFLLRWGRDVESAQWVFGDGATSSETEPTHIFESAGPWTVEATATDAAGKTATVQQELYLDAYPLFVEVDLQQDTAELSFDWGWPPDSITWSVPTGCSFIDDSDAATPEPTVRCYRPGSYPVRLDLADTTRSATATTTLTVEEVPLRIEVDIDQDQATFTPVWYEELSNIVWNFGDGQTSTDLAPTHSYRAYRIFQVTASASSGGQALQATKEVPIFEIPLRVDATLEAGNLWDAAIDWAPATSVTWDFGDDADGHTHDDATGQSTVQHTYDRKGTYTVQVTASDGTHTEIWTGTVDLPASLPPTWSPLDKSRLRPGAQMVTEGQQCTTSFLFHQDWERFFLATAAHCAGDAGGTAGQNFSTDCRKNKSFDMDTEVTFRDWGATDQPDDATDVTGKLVYSSWKSMTDAGITINDPLCTGNDFALVEIDRSVLGQVHPAVLYFEGPLALHETIQESPSTGDSVRSYGASSTRNPGKVGENHAMNAKAGTYSSTERGGWTHTVTFGAPAIPGDSGGPLLGADGSALGVLSTISSDGTNQYTNLAKAIDWMEDHTELKVELVSWDTWKPDPPLSTGENPLI